LRVGKGVAVWYSLAGRSIGVAVTGGAGGTVLVTVGGGSGVRVGTIVETAT